MKFSKLLKTLTLTTIVTVASQSPFFVQKNKVLAQSKSSVIEYAYSTNHYGYYGTISSSVFKNDITNIINQKGSIQNIAFTPQNRFVIIYTTPSQNYPLQYHFYSNGIPQEAINELNSLFSQPFGSITDIEFTPKGGFIILFNENNSYYISSNTPQTLVNDFKTAFNQVSIFQKINRVLFPPQGGVALVVDNYNFVYSNDIPQALVQQFINITQASELGQSIPIITSIAFTPQGGLVATLNNLSTPVYYYGNIPQTLSNQIQQLRSANAIFDAFVIAFSPSNDWVLLNDVTSYGSGPCIACTEF
ncbi:MAG: hypothetical protein V7L04_04955 [Nostoc sp.]|uniref:hypothetical protein n=1 Tax=Nostoc sp. TaxID=1180 RepID=UPI002FF76EC1